MKNKKLNKIIFILLIIPIICNIWQNWYYKYELFVPILNFFLIADYEVKEIKNLLNNDIIIISLPPDSLGKSNFDRFYESGDIFSFYLYLNKNNSQSLVYNNNLYGETQIIKTDNKIVETNFKYLEPHNPAIIDSNFISNTQTFKPENFNKSYHYFLKNYISFIKLTLLLILSEIILLSKLNFFRTFKFLFKKFTLLFINSNFTKKVTKFEQLNIEEIISFFLLLFINTIFMLINMLYLYGETNFLIIFNKVIF